MATRVGVELSPVACRIVELEGAPLEPGQPLATRVRSYAVLPPAGPEADSGFASLRRRSVSVVVWGARSDHRQVVVSNGPYDKMRAEALAAARDAGVDMRDTLSDIAPASTAIKGASRQPVVLALASADEVSAAVQPLVEAGVRVRSVITPADALLGLARARQAFAVPGGIEAYVAMDETVTCVALVRDGSLLSARELTWGYSDGRRKSAPLSAALSRRDDLAKRLVDELSDFLTAVGPGGSAVTQVSICGGLPELRTMTAPLMEHLDVEVEALDSLFGIDAEHLPEPADRFRDRAAELRLAWSAAADSRGPIDLLRHRRRRRRRMVLARAAVVAGVAAGLGAGWAIQQSQWWQSTEPESRQARQTPPARPAPPAPAVTAPRTPAPSPAATAPPATRTPVAPPATTAAPPATRTPIAPPAPTAPLPATRTSVAPPAATAAPPATPAPTRTPVKPPPALTTPAAPPPAPVTPPPPAAQVQTSPAVVAPPSSVTGGPAVPPAARGTVEVERPAPAPAARRAEPPPVPFDAVLGTILYSPDRKFAIVNGRIVGLGDEVNGARVVDITPTTVLLRDGRGRLRSLTLDPVGPSPRSAP